MQNDQWGSSKLNNQRKCYIMAYKYGSAGNGSKAMKTSIYRNGNIQPISAMKYVM